MIITQTPLRISFFGGGTDYPEYFTKHGGAVLGTAIDKYAYLSVSRFHSELFDYSTRISYRQVECVKSLEEIQHAPFRECMRWCGVTKDVEINYSAEMPAFTGLGSSSTFVVGLMNSLNAYQGNYVAPIEMAYQAIRLEREVLGESVGCQDQTFAAMGGFNVMEFHRTDDIRVDRIPLSPARMEAFEDHLMLFFTGLKRRAEEQASDQVKRVDSNSDTLAKMRLMVDEGYNILVNNGVSLSEFGSLLDKSWRLKRSLSENISNGPIDEIYTAGMEAGALGGKLLGAGGGGFLLFFVPPERRQNLRATLGHLCELPVKVNAAGSRVIHA